MRIDNSLKNIKYTWIMTAVRALSKFAIQTAVIMMLSIEYVGLSGLFSNVLYTLSLADLGIGVAISFSLYGPIARGDYSEINAIMSFYKRVYICVGLFILIVGLSLTPIIDILVKKVPNIPHFHLIYALYVINSAISYFFSYKATLLSASEKLYLVSLNENVALGLSTIVQIVVLFFTRDYVLFLTIGIVFVLLQNISITYIANKKYPFLQNKEKKALSKETLNTILKNTGAMMFHKIGGIVVFATDNIIISKMLGLAAAGIYSNYVIIISGIVAFTKKVFDSITASAGNLVAEHSVEKQEDIFLKTMFADFWIYSFVGTGFLALLNPFIGNIWIGKEYIFGLPVVVLIVIKEYLTGMREGVGVFINAKGLYWHNKFVPIYESVINIIASIILVKQFGIVGVILGTIISSLATCVWNGPYVLYKYGFEKSGREYVIRYCRYFLSFILAAGVTWVTTTMISSGLHVNNDFRTVKSIIAFILQMLDVAVIPNVIIWALYRKTEEYQYFVDVLLRRIKNSLT